MKVFKAGDLVRRVNHTFLTIAVGDIVVVESYHQIQLKVRTLDGKSIWGAYDPENFELVTVGDTKTESRALPTDSAERKAYPMYSGMLAYFPAALAQVARHSLLANEKHNPGLPLQHARGKSGDHKDCIIRHLVDAAEVTGARRTEELRAMAWRSLALLQEHLESEGAPAAPAATFEDKKNG